MMSFRYVTAMALPVAMLSSLGVFAAKQQRRAVTSLVDQLRVNDLHARVQAAIRLLELGSDAQPAYPALVQTFADDEALDYLVAAQALYARPRPAEDVLLLAECLKHGTKARVAAAWEIGRMGPAVGDRIKQRLIDSLQYPDKHERNFVVLALAAGSTAAGDVARAILNVATDAGSEQMDYKYPRATATLAIGMLGSAAHEAVPALLDIVRTHDSWEYQRAAACWALGRIGGSGEALAVLKQSSGDANPLVRSHASMAIHALASAPGRGAERTENTSEKDIAALVRTLQTEPSRINTRVVDGLRALGEFAGAARPIRKLGTQRAALPVHESITLALGYLDSLARPPGADEVSRQERDGALSETTVRYLMALGGIQQGIAPVLLESLAVGERNERVIAIRRLGAVGPAASAAIPALEAAARDPDWIVRREAFLALRRIVKQ